MLSFFVSETEVRPVFIVFPVIFYFIVEYARRLKKYYYTPVYFPFALESLNPVFAKYYGTNIMHPKITDSPDEINSLRRKAKIDGVISIIVSAYLIPLTVGFLSSLIVEKSEFYLALIIIVVIRFNNISRAILDYDIFHTHFKSKKGLISFIMYLHLAITIYSMAKGYINYRPYVVNQEWWNYLSNFAENTVIGIGLQGIIFGALASMFASKLLDESLRREINYEFPETYPNHPEQNTERPDL